MRKRRRYASFFEPHLSSKFDLEDGKKLKQLKEGHIVGAGLDAIERSGDIRITSLQQNPDAPPDFIAKDENEQCIGIEVVELVDQFAIEQNEKGFDYVRFWNFEEVTNKIRQILQTKDGKIFRGGQYHKIVILIHVDEPSITFESLSKTIVDHKFRGLRQVDEAYLLFSFDPNFSDNLLDFPVIKLVVERVNN